MSDPWAPIASRAVSNIIGTNNEALGIGLSVFLAVFVAGVVAWRHLHRPVDPAELERLRRATIHRDGKMGDGEILDVDAASTPDTILIIYAYSVAGVIYTASQDLIALRPRLPADLMTMVGPISVKFDPRNPANSIVVCEEWSGLRSLKGKSRAV
jgi:hypothetical protein